MKTCKGFWMHNVEIDYIDKETYTITGRGGVFPAVPLTDFEAYKNKVKKEINRQLTSGNFSSFPSVRMVLEKLKSELELD